DAIQPGTKGFGHLKRFQSAKCIKPNLLMKIEGVSSVWNETTQVIEQRFFMAIQQANKRLSIAPLRFSDPQGFFESGQFLLGRACSARIHRFLMVSRSGETVQTFLLKAVLC